MENDENISLFVKDGKYYIIKDKLLKETGIEYQDGDMMRIFNNMCEYKRN